MEPACLADFARFVAYNTERHDIESENVSVNELCANMAFVYAEGVADGDDGFLSIDPTTEAPFEREEDEWLEGDLGGRLYYLADYENIQGSTVVIYGVFEK